MAHALTNGKNNKPNASVTACGDGEGKPTTFHDFLGKKGQGQESPPATVSGRRPPAEVSPSSTSDLGSERNVHNHLEGIPFYGSRGDIKVPGSSSRFSGNKRSNSDSFMMSSRDTVPQGQADSQDSQLLTKLLRYSTGERQRRPHDEETSFGMRQMRPIQASLIPQSSAGGRADANTSKWDRAIPVNLGPTMQHPLCAGQVTPLSYQAHTNRFKDMSTGPCVITQTAADEGSRTGIKGSGILSTINATGAISKRQPSGLLIRNNKPTSSVCVLETESSTTPSQRGTESVGSQMTIFYGGKAHVFDNVYPNKADVIMALAGSNGGSWSTTYTPNKAVKQSPGEKRLPHEDDSILKELHFRPSD